MAVENTSILGSLGIQPVYFIGQVINFVVLFVILRKFLYRPILAKLKQRARLVKKGVVAAEKNIKNQEEMEQKRQREFKKAQQEIQEMLKKAKVNGEEIYQQYMDKGKTDAKRYMEQEKQKFNEYMQEQEKRMQQQMVDLSTQIAKQVLTQYFDDSSKQSNIIDAQLTQLAKNQI